MTQLRPAHTQPASSPPHAPSHAPMSAVGLDGRPGTGDMRPSGVLTMWKPLAGSVPHGGHWFAVVHSGFGQHSVARWPAQGIAVDAGPASLMRIELFAAADEQAFSAGKGRKVSELAIRTNAFFVENGPLYRGWIGLDDDVMDYARGVQAAQSLLLPKLCFSLLDPELAQRTDRPSPDRVEQVYRKSILHHAQVLAGIHRDLDEQMAQLALPARRTSPYLISEESETPGEERELRKAVGELRQQLADREAAEEREVRRAFDDDMEKALSDLEQKREAIAAERAELMESVRAVEEEREELLARQSNSDQRTEKAEEDLQRGIERMVLEIRRLEEEQLNKDAKAQEVAREQDEVLEEARKELTEAQEEIRRRESQIDAQEQALIQ